MSIAIVKKEEMAPQYDANGFSRMEMLPGTFPRRPQLQMLFEGRA